MVNQKEIIVTKRDGRNKKFESSRIENALLKAYKDVYEDNYIIHLEQIGNVKNEVVSNIKNCNIDIVSVENIQDEIIKVLNKFNKKVSDSYSRYREIRDVARKENTYKDFMSIVNTVSNDITKDNANMNAETPAGMMMKFASETTKVFAKDKLISREASEAMDENYIYIHDRDYYPTKSLTCLQHPMDKILGNGFRAGHGSSRPVKRIETSSIIGCISMEQIQNEMHRQ